MKQPHLPDVAFGKAAAKSGRQIPSQPLLSTVHHKRHAPCGETAMGTSERPKEVTVLETADERRSNR
jgi:hypothetical protein